MKTPKTSTNKSVFIKLFDIRECIKNIISSDNVPFNSTIDYYSNCDKIFSNLLMWRLTESKVFGTFIKCCIYVCVCVVYIGISLLYVKGVYFVESFLSFSKSGIIIQIIKVHDCRDRNTTQFEQHFFLLIFDIFTCFIYLSR